MFKSLPGIFRKLLPVIALIVLAWLAGGTDVFSSTVHKHFSHAFAAYGTKLIPFAVNLFVGAIFFWIAWVLYAPLKNHLAQLLCRTKCNERARSVVVRSVQLAYWLIASLVSFSFIAPDLLSKMFLGVSLLGAALTLALQGVARDFISGVFLHINPKIAIGDNVEVVGSQVKGKITDISYLQMMISCDDGIIVVPNSEFWSKAVKVLKRSGEVTAKQS